MKLVVDNLARLALVCVVLFGSGCLGWLTRGSDEIPEAVHPEPIYEELFSHYVELCAVSQYRSLEHGEGGSPGHAVMYLKGACKDETATHPALRPCRREATSLDDLEHGAGISVNRWFHNANWVAIPGARLFYDGDLEEGERVDRAAVDRAIQQSLDLGVFDGIVVHPDVPGGDSMSVEQLIETQSLATDFALRFSRTVFCARMPVTDEMMDEIIAYLNTINEEYADGVTDYDWSGYADNCVHLLRNALAAASIWPPVSVRATKLRQVANLAVPANEFFNLAKLGEKGPLEDGRDVYRTDTARDALLDFRWLPRRHGAMVTLHPVHANNKIYDTKTRILVLQAPFKLGVSRGANRLYESPHATELRANLEYFKGIYASLLDRGDRLIAGGFLPLRSIQYLHVTKRYFEYVADQYEEVEQMLFRMDDAGAE